MESCPVESLALDPIAQRRTRRRRALLVVLLSASVATLGASAMSLAVFTDNAASAGAWTSGSVVLGVTPGVTFDAVNILPGDTGSQTVAVSNTGTGDLRYAVSTTFTNADGKGLAAQLQLTIRAGTCLAAGATLYSGSLAIAALGSNVQGSHPGDRLVAAGATDSLCFAWTFPTGSGNAFQSAAASATFTFDAEQTANN
jgi:hypothetical protein